MDILDRFYAAALKVEPVKVDIERVLPLDQARMGGIRRHFAEELERDFALHAFHRRRVFIQCSPVLYRIARRWKGGVDAPDEIPEQPEYSPDLPDILLVPEDHPLMVGCTLADWQVFFLITGIAVPMYTPREFPLGTFAIGNQVREMYP